MSEHDTFKFSGQSFWPPDEMAVALCGLLSLLLARAALGTDALYENDGTYILSRRQQTIRF